MKQLSAGPPHSGQLFSVATAGVDANRVFVFKIALSGEVPIDDGLLACIEMVPRRADRVFKVPAFVVPGSNIC